MYRLLALDLDGTVIGEDRRITHRRISMRWIKLGRRQLRRAAWSGRSRRPIMPSEGVGW